MAETINDAVLPILVKIQTELASFRKSVDERFDRMDSRLDRIEEVARNQRRDIAGILVMMKGTVGVFDERVGELEQRVTALERHKT